MERIGVFVCHCGTNIAGTVDVAKVAEELGKVDGVVYSTHYTYMCSSAGQQMIEDHIKNDKLTGVVLCSCSPRMHENIPFMRRTCWSQPILKLKLQISVNRLHG